VERGLPSNSIYQLLQSGDGTFWITGPNTIASVPESDMDAPWDEATFLSVKIYNMPYGAEGAQLYGGRAPAGYLAPDQTVWFPTNRGVAHVTPQVATITGPPPHAIIEAVEEDGRVVAPTDALQVPANVHRLTFDFSAIYLRPQTQLHFRYMLEEFDHTWINATSQDKATYTNLRAGHYTFRVQAYDASRPPALEEASIRLQQTSHFYQTIWFYTLCAVLLTLIGLAIYRMRVERLRGRFTAVMEERSRLAREMHDTVIQSCTGVSALLEAIDSTQNGTPGEAHHGAQMHAELLSLARQQTRQTIETARQVVWNIRHQNENDVEVVAAIHAYVAQMAREDVRMTVDVRGAQALWLPSSIAHELLMTVREAVYNALQHSGSRRIQIAVRRVQGNLDVRIEDDGAGIPPTVLAQPPDGHYGIIGMRERMRKVNGDFDIVSAVGEGTTVRVRIPLLRHAEVHP
jgi:signal transduction histidine kinase